MSMNVNRVTLYDDWVWIKDKAFFVNESNCLPKFLVEWNDVDCMFAVTSRFGSRLARDTEDRSQTGAFSITALHSIGETLHGLHPDVSKLPSDLLPKEPSGLKAIFVGIQMPLNLFDLCRDLEEYFTNAAEKLGLQIVHEVMFEAAARQADSYYEQMSEICRQDLLQKIAFVEDELKNIAFERENCTVMKDLEDVYRREDEAVTKLISALADYYNYELQPYLDSHHLATKSIQQCSRLIKSQDIGERVRNESKEQHLYWSCLLLESKEVILKLNVEHQAEIVSIFQDLIRQIKVDKKRFGSAAFDLVAAERELLLYKELPAAKVQLLQSKRKQLKQDKDKIILQVPEGSAALASPEARKLLKEKDKIQEKIYNIELDILIEKMKFLNARIELRKREISDAEEESIVFHDAVEDVGELSEEEDCKSVIFDEELTKLKQERVKVSVYQSRIRARKEEFLCYVRSRQFQEEEKETRQFRHHQIQKKRDQQKENTKEQKNFIFEERRKTIERLKEYKVKYASPATIRPQKFQKTNKKQQEHKPASISVLTAQPKNMTSISSSNKACILDKSKNLLKTSVERQGNTTKVVNGSSDSEHVAVGALVMSDRQYPKDDKFQSPPTKTADSSPLPPAAGAPPPAPPPPPAAPPPPALAPPHIPTLSKAGTGFSNIAESLSSLKKVDQSNKDGSNSSQPGHIDLDSILTSRSRLKPASERQERSSISHHSDPLTEIFNMIRSGVTLRKVKVDHADGAHHNEPINSSSAPGNDVRSALHNTLINKIGHGVRGSSPESDSEYGSEEDEFDD